MRDRSERDEIKSAKLAEARREVKALAYDPPFAMAIFRCRLLAIGLCGAELRAELSNGSPNNVVQLRR